MDVRQTSKSQNPRIQSKLCSNYSSMKNICNIGPTEPVVVNNANSVLQMNKCKLSSNITKIEQ